MQEIVKLARRALKMSLFLQDLARNLYWSCYFVLASLVRLARNLARLVHLAVRYMLQEILQEIMPDFTSCKILATPCMILHFARFYICQWIYLLQNFCTLNLLLLAEFSLDYLLQKIFSYGSQLGHRTFNAVGKALKRYYIYMYYIPWVLMLILLVSLASYSSLIG